MERIDRSTARGVMQAAGAAMEPVLEKFGLMMDRVGCTFSPEDGTVTVKVRMSLAGVAPSDRERREFERLAPAYGIRAGDFEALITHYGQGYILKGFKPRSTRFPVAVARTGDGKLFRLPLSVLRPLQEKARLAQ